MRRLFVTLAASVALTFGMALPVRAIGLTLVTVTCSDGDSVTATVNADELAGLTDAINAMTLYPAGLSCTLGTAPVLTSIGGVASAWQASGFVVGGGRFQLFCPPGAGCPPSGLSPMSSGSPAPRYVRRSRRSCRAAC